MKKPGPAAGTLTGLVLTAPLTALLYLVNRTTGLPFPPFLAFDWVRDRLPPGIINAGIDRLAGTLAALGLSVRETAKPAEIILVLGTFVLAGTVAGAVFFAAAKRVRTDRLDKAGLVLGLAFGLPLAAVAAVSRGLAPALRGPGAAWTVAAFLGWGFAVARVRSVLGAPAAAVPASGAPAAVRRIGRRRFMVTLGTASALITVGGTVLGRILSRRVGSDQGTAALVPPRSSEAGGPGEAPPAGGASFVPAPGSRPELTPVTEHYRIDINLDPPALRAGEWSLTIGGLVRGPLTLTLRDLVEKYEPKHQFITMSCISNSVGGDLIGTTRWTGVSVRTILEQAGVEEGAAALEVTSADGFHESVPLELIRTDDRIMFTYAWDGKPLAAEHGSPLRIYIPDRYGMKQPKWITKADVVARGRDGYWVERGWDRAARAKATSVIDTVAVDAVVKDDRGRLLVPIGGIAWAGARGISKVEVRIDEGDWQPAELKRPLSGTTWVIWRMDWPFQAGPHRFTVRCAEGDGTPQIETAADTFPGGATGLHRIKRRIEPRKEPPRGPGTGEG